MGDVIVEIEISRTSGLVVEVEVFIIHLGDSLLNLPSVIVLGKLLSYNYAAWLYYVFMYVVDGFWGIMYIYRRCSCLEEQPSADPVLESWGSEKTIGA